MTLTLQEEQFKERRCRLICLDLDGTLLNDEKEIDPEDIREIREASEKGIEIALVTGRMPAATEPIAKKLGVPCILACDAGTYIEKENQCISSEYLPIAAMRMVYGSRQFSYPSLDLPSQTMVCDGYGSGDREGD